MSQPSMGVGGSSGTKKLSSQQTTANIYTLIVIKPERCFSLKCPHTGCRACSPPPALREALTNKHAVQRTAKQLSGHAPAHANALAQANAPKTPSCSSLSQSVHHRPDPASQAACVCGDKPLRPGRSPFQTSEDGQWSEGRTMIDTCTDVHPSR
jgi:hypothetical protein